MELGGKRTLREFRGVGGTANPTPIPLQSVIDRMLEKVRTDRYALEVNWPTSQDNRGKFSNDEKRITYAREMEECRRPP